MKIKPKHLGKVLSVRFWDHAIGGDVEPIECEAIGKVVRVDSLCVWLEHWAVHSSDAELKENNHEQSAILQSTIISFIQWAIKKL